MKTEYIIIIILVIILFLVYKKQENFLVGNEAVQNISKIYTDASGIVTFNNINANKMKMLDLSGNNIDGNNIRGNNIDGNIIRGNNIRGNNISTNDLSANNINVMNKLIFEIDKTNNKFEGIHTFWIQSGWDASQKGFITNPDGEYYNADKWVCMLSNNYDYQNHHGMRTYIDTVTNNWCIYKWLDLGKAAYVTVMCYPRQIFSKVWANKFEHTKVDNIGPSGPDWNTRV
jgi:hypothetical protein